MDKKDIVIICLVILVVALAVAFGLYVTQQENTQNSSVNVKNNTSIANNTSSVNVEKVNTEDVPVSYEKEAPTDYNSPDSEYYKSDVDGSYHKKEAGGNYIYSQDEVTGEWSYWADKS